MKVYHVYRHEKASWCEDYEMIVVAEDELHAERKARWASSSFRNSHNGGYGGLFRQWLDSERPQPYNSFGNGSAMRCSFIGGHYENPNDVIKYAKMSAAVTHNHPEGQKGAIVTTMCVYMAKHGCSKDEIYRYASRYYGDEERYQYPITMSLREMRDIYKWDETCQGSVPVAIRCFLESDSWESFMRNVMSLPCDMDTLGAIGGGITAEFYKGTGFNEKEVLSQYLEENLYDLAFEE